MSSSSSSLKEAARAGNGNRLIHDPFTDSQVLGDPAGNLLVLAGDLVRLESQTGRSLHSSEESRDENGVEGIVRQPSDHHDGQLLLRCVGRGLGGLTLNDPSVGLELFPVVR